MRSLCTLICFTFLAVFARAAEWKNETYGCSANLPEAAGWQPIEAPSTPEITVLVAMQQPQKQAVFGINVLHNLPSTNLHDAPTIAAIEQSLRGLGYQFIGHSTVAAAGREWVQYPVRGVNPPMTGLIRYTSANNQIYVVSLLRGGGQEAAQDPELQTAAASVRIGAAAATGPAVAAAPVAPAPSAAPSPTALAPSAVNPAPAAKRAPDSPATAAEDEGNVAIGPITLTRQQFKLTIYGLVGLVVLMILLKIINAGGDKPQQPRR